MTANFVLIYDASLESHQVYYTCYTNNTSMKSARKKTSNELLFKIIVIGESATGKSCLMVRYIKDDFNPEYSVTVGTS